MSRAFMLTLCLVFYIGVADAERKRVTLVPDPDVYSDADIKEEILFGREMAAIILANKTLVDKPPLLKYVNQLGQSIARHANRPELQFYFAVVESAEINAYAAPGGYIFITSSAIALMQDEAELAGVLAHEIAHIAQRDIVKSLNIREADKSMISVLGKVIGSRAETANIIYQQAVDHAVDVLFSRGLSVQDEFDADQEGAYLAAMAGYDPAANHRFLARIKRTVESSQGEMNNTHPPFSERLSHLRIFIDNEGLSKLEVRAVKNRFSRYTGSGN